MTDSLQDPPFSSTLKRSFTSSTRLGPPPPYPHSEMSSRIQNAECYRANVNPSKRSASHSERSEECAPLQTDSPYRTTACPGHGIANSTENKHNIFSKIYHYFLSFFFKEPPDTTQELGGVDITKLKDFGFLVNDLKKLAAQDSQSHWLSALNDFCAQLPDKLAEDTDGIKREVICAIAVEGLLNMSAFATHYEKFVSYYKLDPSIFSGKKAKLASTRSTSDTEKQPSFPLEPEKQDALRNYFTHFAFDVLGEISCRADKSLKSSFWVPHFLAKPFILFRIRTKFSQQAKETLSAAREILRKIGNYEYGSPPKLDTALQEVANIALYSSFSSETQINAGNKIASLLEDFEKHISNCTRENVNSLVKTVNDAVKNDVVPSRPPSAPPLPIKNDTSHPLP